MLGPSLVLAELVMTLAAHAAAPVPVQSDGHVLLAFELPLNRANPDEVRLLDADRAELLADYSGDALSKRIAMVGNGALLYVELTCEAGAVPRHLVSVIRSGAMVEPGEPIAVSAAAPDRIGPPFSRGTWVAVHSPDWARGHRRVIHTIDGQNRIPGRFAIDWVKVDDKGLISRGDPDRPADTLGYGEPVLAGAEAEVAAAFDGMAESPSIKGNPKHGAGEAAGNYVALDLGDGHFLFYEHLKPGSLRVKAGQRVKRGEVIGELGFTGDSTGPHLHMHVADSPDPVTAEGLPFLLEGFTRIGRYREIGKLGEARWEAGKEETRPDWPGSNVVGRF